MNIEDDLNLIAEEINRVEQVMFSIAEIGARPINNEKEPFYLLLKAFPGTRITAFETEDALCATLNQSADPGVEFHPVALGLTEEERPFYQTQLPYCSSLYRPIPWVIENYNNMEVAGLKSVERIRTMSLDRFVSQQGISPIDFIKIDIQGAELDVFRGGKNSLAETVAIVSEVEFIQIYEDQPLFGDVCAYLAEQRFMFHKFLGFGNRALKPVLIDNNPNLGSQFLWADAVFVRNLKTIDLLRPVQILKLGILTYLYGSPDVSFYCIRKYDESQSTDLLSRFMSLSSSR